MTDWLNRCHTGDVRAVLRQMIAEGVQVNTIVTSPPYWGLRSYLPPDHPDKHLEIGSEPTIGQFLTTMVEVFDLARQVLRPDGTMWVNMGDSYAGSRSGPDTGSTLQGSRHNQNAAKVAKQAMVASRRRDDQPIPRSDLRMPGFKPKDLVGQPWRLALALQAGTARCTTCGAEHAVDAWPVRNGHRVCIDCLLEWRHDSKVVEAKPGWWLRQDIVWAKPNPMPESTTDRCTKAHEYLFLLAKSERYYFDQDAIAEPVGGGAHARRAVSNGVGFGYADPDPKPRTRTPTGWETGPGGHAAFHRDGREKPRIRAAGALAPSKQEQAFLEGDERHRTKSGLLAYSQRVTAALEQLADQPKAELWENDSAYGDGKSERMGRGPGWRKLADHGTGIKSNGSMDEALAELRDTRNKRSVWTVASEPYKEAHFATFPRKLIEPCILAGCPPGGVVLDIFMGSGTTAQVAQALGRQFIGIDIDARNERMQAGRTRQPSLILE